MPPRKKAPKKQGGVNALDTTDIWLGEDSLIAEALLKSDVIRFELSLATVKEPVEPTAFLELPGGVSIALPEILTPVVQKPPVIYDTSPSTVLFDIVVQEIDDLIEKQEKQKTHKPVVEENTAPLSRHLAAAEIDMVCESCGCYWHNHVPTSSQQKTDFDKCYNCDKCFFGWMYTYEKMIKAPVNVEEMIVRAGLSSVSNQLSVKVNRPVLQDKWKDFPL